MTLKLCGYRGLLHPLQKPVAEEYTEWKKCKITQCNAQSGKGVDTSLTGKSVDPRLALEINGEINRQEIKITTSRRVNGCRTMKAGGRVRTGNEIDWVFGTFFTAQSRDRRPRTHLAEPSNETNTNTNTNTTDDCM